jgi:hypothetical protein
MPDPTTDPGVVSIDAAGSEEARLAAETALLEQTDNRPRSEDGPQPEDPDAADR